jgi:hypothetical protein
MNTIRAIPARTTSMQRHKTTMVTISEERMALWSPASLARTCTCTRSELRCNVLELSAHSPWFLALWKNLSWKIDIWECGEKVGRFQELRGHRRDCIGFEKLAEKDVSTVGGMSIVKREATERREWEHIGREDTVEQSSLWQVGWAGLAERCDHAGPTKQDHALERAVSMRLERSTHEWKGVWTFWRKP